MYSVLFYRTRRNECPIDNFILDLDKKTRAKIERFIAYLKINGPDLKRPYADIVRGKIRELRIEFGHNNVRLLYFFFVDQNIIIVHGFLKKTRALNPADIDLAERRMADWITRFQ